MSARSGQAAAFGSVTEFLRGLRVGLEDGLDPIAASERAARAAPPRLREAFEAMARRSRGDYEEDEWGFDEEFAEAAYPVFEWLYDTYWRVVAAGIENVPAQGRAMIVANHAGVLPFDATMMTVALRKHHSQPRWPSFMVLDWAFGLPFASFFMRKVGGVPASPYNATRLLEQDRPVMVFPEGIKGTGKPYSERYRLQRFGRGGFVEIAIRTGSPIVPVAVVGSEEIYPKIAENETVAKLLRLPYLPITPTFPLLGPLGMVPLPSKWRIEFCPPIDLSEYSVEAAGDRALMMELSERIRETIQDRVYANLVERGPAFL